MEGSSSRQFYKICVFCGSRPGKNKVFAEAAYNLGKVLAARNIHLVYGGGSLGLMGRVAAAASLGGSHVMGITPFALASENLTGKKVGDEVQVLTMHERITSMLLNSNAIIVLPGGFGTLEELFQVASWAQLNIHRKPIGLLNINNFFDSLLCFLDQAVEQEFISEATRQILVVASDAHELIDKLQAFSYVPGAVGTKIDWSVRSRKKSKLDLSLNL